MAVGSDFDISKAFPENNESLNDNEDDLFKKQLVAQLNDSYITGFASPQSLI